jgi:hypothetical protein
MTGLVSVDPNTIIVLAIVIGAIQIGVHVIKRALDVWFDTAGRRDPIERLADSVRDGVPPYVGFDAPEVAPEDEPNWANKAPHDSGVRHLFGLRDQPVVVGGNPARFDVTGLASRVLLTETPPETPAETSGRHAVTETLAAVTDDEPVAEEVGVS